MPKVTAEQIVQDVQEKYGKTVNVEDVQEALGELRETMGDRIVYPINGGEIGLIVSGEDTLFAVQEIQLMYDL